MAVIQGCVIDVSSGKLRLADFAVGLTPPTSVDCPLTGTETTANDAGVVDESVPLTSGTELATRTQHPLQGLNPRVGVVIPVRDSRRTISRCIQALLDQEYPDFHIYVVANPEDQDDSWPALRDFQGESRVTCLKWARPMEWRGRDGNAKREFGARIALEDGADIVAFIDSQVETPPNWLSSAVVLLDQARADGLAGISTRNPNDRCLAAVYQDGSLFSEWPRYGTGSWLNRDNVGKVEQLPITANLIVRAEALRAIESSWPRVCPYGWEDFHLDQALLDSGAALLCTNRSHVFRLHKPKFRLAKHVTAGMAAGEFYRRFPRNGFVRRRLGQAALVLFAALGTALLVAADILIRTQFLLLLTTIAALLTLLPLGLRSMAQTRDWRAFCFPLLDILHIGSWIAGLSIALVGPQPIKDAVWRFFTTRR